MKKLSSVTFFIYLILSIYFIDLVRNTKKIKTVSQLRSKEDFISSILSKSKLLMDNHINMHKTLENSLRPENLHEVQKKVHELQIEFMLEHQKIVEELTKAMGEELNEDLKKNMQTILDHINLLKSKEENILTEYQKSHDNYLEAEHAKKQTEQEFTPFSPVSFVQEKKKSENRLKGNIIKKVVNSETLQTLTMMCMQAYQNIIPPEFCWKKGADFGVIPTNCPKGMFRSLALCYDYCPSNYTFVAGVCWENCSKGTDIGAMCVGGGVFKFKHSYISRSITNFSNEIPCGEGMYKGGALCYRDCKNIGMANCGIGACSITADACMSSIMGMVVGVIQGLVETIGFIVSFGGTSAITATAKATFKSLGKGVIKGALKATKNYLIKIGKEAAKLKMKQYVKDKAKEFLKDNASEILQDVFIDKVSESIINRSITTDIDTFDEDYFISKIDVLGIGPAVTSCQAANQSSQDAANCAQAVLDSIGKVDPTGLSTIAAAFAKPSCDVPSTLSEDAKKLIEEEEKNRLAIESKVSPYCFKMWDGCNFTGNSIEVCKNTQPSTTFSFVNWKNKAASIITGVGVSLGVSNTDVDTQIKTGNFDFIVMSPETQHPCLRDEYGKDWDKSLKVAVFDFNNCFLFFEKPNFEGLKEAVCSSRDLRLLKGRAQSYSRFSSEKSSIVAYDQAGQKGNTFTVDQIKEADLSKRGWGNKIQSVKMLPIVQPDCVYVCQDCNYEGWCDNVCKDYAFNGLNNQISSIKIGKNVKFGIFLDFIGTDSKYLIGKSGEEYPCLSQNGMDNIISNFAIKGENCAIGFTGVNFTGSSRVYCRSETLDGTMDQKINSIKKIDNTNTQIKITVFKEPNQLGASLEVSGDIPDLGKLNWGNKIRSIQFLDSNGVH